VRFHGHEAGSLELAAAILERLKAAHALRREVLALVRHHGTHPTAEWGDAACRRFLQRLGEDGLDLARWGAFRLADQRAKGLNVEAREREHAAILARLEALAATAPPLTVKALALDGAALMALVGRSGGPWLGALQRDLLEAVLEHPDLNTPEALAELVKRRS
jgi:tRNA nucleotidyltransferase (CCA-adding enzyme)